MVGGEGGHYLCITAEWACPPPALGSLGHAGLLGQKLNIRQQLVKENRFLVGFLFLLMQMLLG